MLMERIDNARQFADTLQNSFSEIIPKALLKMNTEKILYIIYQEVVTLIVCERLSKRGR